MTNEAQDQISREAWVESSSHTNCGITSSGTTVLQSSGILNTGSTSGFTPDLVTFYGHYSASVMIRTDVFPDRVEILYKRQSMLSNGYQSPPAQVYKIVHSCVDGKWNVSDPIFGEILPRTEEDYVFDGQNA